jgi:Xaa-Pro aminopeptidase
MDSGAEYNYYNADITRTLPVNGTFSKEQSIIYQIVLRANKECIKKIKPGVKLSYLKKFTREFLAKELLKIGLIKNPKEVIKYYMHSVGHHLGLDTHDAVPLANTEIGDNDTLKPGNVITIEPGLYLPETDKIIPLKYRRIGVRIEDDVLVTNNGCEVLTSTLPKEIAELKKLMQ